VERVRKMGWLSLTKDEVIEYQTLPQNIRLTRYMKSHKDERCPYCKRLVGNHSLKRFKRCVYQEKLKIDAINTRDKVLSQLPEPLPESSESKIIVP
jgi:hypothetical protein